MFDFAHRSPGGRVFGFGGAKNNVADCVFDCAKCAVL